MKIRWLGHAAFAIESNGLRIITDPYTPEDLDFPPVTESADIVIRSSADDRGHCNAEMIAGNPVVVTATEIVEKGANVRGLSIKAIAAKESLIHKERPLDNAMYRFELEGIQVCHMGDVGNRLTDNQVEALSGTDVLIAPVGGPPTIDLDDLQDAISQIRPHMIIPMHFGVPGCKVRMFPVTVFTSRFPASLVRWTDAVEVSVSREDLPAEQVVVLKPSVLEKSVRPDASRVGQAV